LVGCRRPPRLEAKSLRHLLLTGLFAISLGTTSCSFRKNAPDASQFNASAATQLGCLDQAGAQIQGFLQGTASEQDVGQVYDCTSRVLDDFVNDTHGADPTSFSADELRRFLTTYFVHEIKLTDELMLQVGIFKQAFVGGAPDRITVDEIHRLQSILRILKQQTQKMLPFMPIGTSSSGATGFAGKTWRDITPAMLEQFGTTVNSAAKALGDALDGGQGLPYRFDQLDDLLAAFEDAIPASTTDLPQTRSFIQSLRKNLDIISRAKQTALNPEVGSPALRLDPQSALAGQTTLQPLFLQIAAALNQVLEPAKPYQFAELGKQIHTLLNAMPSGSAYQYPRGFLTKALLPLDALTKLGTPITVTERMTLLQLLVPRGSQVSSGSDWTALLSTAGHWLDVLVRLEWYLDDARAAEAQTKRLQGTDLQLFRGIFDHVYKILADVVTRHPGQLIDFDELSRLVSALPEGATPASNASINTLLRPLIQRLIGGVDLGNTGRAAPGLVPGNMLKLHDIFYNWYEGQRFLETLFTRVQHANGDGPDKDYVRDTLLKSPAAAELWNEVYTQAPGSGWTPITILAAKRIENLLRALRPLFHGDDGEISFPSYGQGLRYSFNNMSQLNWMQSTSRLLIRGYAENDTPDEKSKTAPIRAQVDEIGFSDDPRAGLGVNLKEFSQFYSDILPFGVSVKIFNPNNPTSATSRFREGDTFTYVSDGNGYMDLNETTTLLAFSISAMRKAYRIHDDIATKCPLLVDADQKPILDIYGKLQITDVCYEKLFYGALHNYWQGLDEMIAYYNGLNSAGQASFQNLLEVSGRDKGVQPGVAYNSDDSEGLVAALQYIEAIFSRYDTDDSGYLSPSEASEAFPVIRNVLEQKAQSLLNTTLTDEQANLVFTYLLAKGQVPSGTWDIVWWTIQKSIPFAGDFRADRLRILQIFSAIAGASTNAANSSGLMTK
jgi:hypothetical protein